jgi:hypothetical protein
MVSMRFCKVSTKRQVGEKFFELVIKNQASSQISVYCLTLFLTGIIGFARLFIKYLEII